MSENERMNIEGVQEYLSDHQAQSPITTKPQATALSSTLATTTATAGTSQSEAHTDQETRLAGQQTPEGALGYQPHKRSGDDWLMTQNELLRQEVEVMREALRQCTEAIKDKQVPLTGYATISSTGAPQQGVPQHAAPEQRRSETDNPSSFSPHYNFQHPLPPFSLPQTLVKPRKKEPLPKFRGDIRTWTRFSIAFQQSTSMYGYTHYENHVRLLEALEPPAIRTVEGLLIHPNNVPLVMKQLEELYGRPEVLAKEIIEGVMQMPKVHPHREGTELTAFSLEVNNLVGHLTATSAASRLQDQTLLDKLVSKLPDARREKWFWFLQNNLYEIADVTRFATWLAAEAFVLRRSHEATRQLTPRVGGNAPPGVFAIQAQIQSEGTGCPVCSETHRIHECLEFVNLNETQRWEIAKENHLCFSCLGRRHSTRECRSSQICGIDGCRHRHNRLLHEREQEHQVAIAETHTVNGTAPCLYKYIPVTVAGPKGERNVLAFVDEGSKASLMEESLATELGLTGPRRTIDLRWIGGKSQQYRGKEIAPKINQFVGVNTLTVPELQLPKQELNRENWTARFPALSGIPFEGYEQKAPRILLGLNHALLIRPHRIVHIDDHHMALETLLGWTIYGGKTENPEPKTITPNKPRKKESKVVTATQSARTPKAPAAKSVTFKRFESAVTEPEIFGTVQPKKTTTRYVKKNESTLMVKELDADITKKVARYANKGVQRNRFRERGYSTQRYFPIEGQANVKKDVHTKWLDKNGHVKLLSSRWWYGENGLRERLVEIKGRYERQIMQLSGGRP